MIDFMQNLQTEEHNFQESFQNAKHPESTLERAGDILGSKDISGMEVRLSNIKIIDNKTPKVFPFPGLAKVYLVNMVITDTSANPILLDLNGFEKVDDGDSILVDRVIYSWKLAPAALTPPSQVHVFTSLLKSKQPLRDVAKIIESVNNDDKYKQLTNTLDTVLKTASQISNISELIFKVASIVGSYLGKVDDKPLLTWIQSFTDINGDYDNLGPTKKSAQNKYASMDLTFIVRDKERQPVGDTGTTVGGTN
jgi:hypothetical protein